MTLQVDLGKGQGKTDLQILISPCAQHVPQAPNPAGTENSTVRTRPESLSSRVRGGSFDLGWTTGAPHSPLPPKRLGSHRGRYGLSGVSQKQKEGPVERNGPAPCH